jgi:TorA maturation chaperone TorD
VVSRPFFSSSGAAIPVAPDDLFQFQEMQLTDYVNGKAGAREDLCRFLSACYYQPATEFSEEHLFDSMLAAATAIDPELAACARRLGEAFVAQDIETLLLDYSRLFIIAPGQVLALPYATFWLTDDQSQRDAATTAVLDFYEQGGFEVSEDLHELPDHVAIELEFLYLLIFAQNFARNQAKISGNADDLVAANVLHRRFVVEHLNVWFGKFATAVKAGAELAFYRELVDFTALFLHMEADLARLH